MYLDALMSLMTGTRFTPTNEPLFFECLLPPADLDSLLWLKLLLAAYDTSKELVQNEYLPRPDQAIRNHYPLEEVWDYVNKLNIDNSTPIG
jgi:hypothetical protein